ncbi:MAG: 2-isopropylmalate synthase [Clostridia bacterium]|nr:2-isopropylmalate synthase [Clostridia bacterium]
MDRKNVLQYDRRTNVLEQAQYKYQLQDVQDPNLYRDLYEYTSVPKVAFNHRVVPMNMPEDIWLTDTTFRDGQQGCQPFSVNQIVDLFKLMSRLGGPQGIVRASEFFLYTEKDREAVRRCQDLGLRFPEITSWIRAVEKDFQLVKDMNLRETGILVSCSDYHIFKKLRMTRAQAMDQYLGVVKSALSYGITPRCHFEDITRADFYGFVVPFATELMKLARESGTPIKIRACDTMGFGVTYPGVAMPRSVQGIIYGLLHYADVPSRWIEWHGHNDFYKVVTNASTAWLYGASAVNCTMLGIGERTGNCPLEAMAMEFASLRGHTGGMDFTAITEIAEYFEKNIGYQIPPRTPFVGRHFNTTRAGIHADGLLKDEEIYNIFDTAALLNRPAGVAIDSFAGLAGITHWVNTFYRLSGVDKIDKRHPAIAAMNADIADIYAKGRNTVMSDVELETLLEKADPELFKALSADKF